MPPRRQTSNSRDKAATSPDVADHDGEVWVLMLRMLADLDQLHAQIQRVLDLLPSETRALLAVWSAGTLSAGDLARHIKLSNAATTTLIDRLEQRKLVRRTRLESNKRFVMITTTDRANERLETIGRFLQSLYDLRAETLPEQTRELERSLHVLRRLLDETITTMRLTPVEVFPQSLDELPIRAFQIADD